MSGSITELAGCFRVVGLNETMEMKIQKHDLDVMSTDVNYIHAMNLDSL